MKKQKTISIIFSFLSILIVASLGSVFVYLGRNWFNLLDKPSQWIPNFVIPIVWSVVYLTAAIILFFWIKDGKVSKKASILFIVNGILNILWCLIFFTLKLTFLGNITIILNLIASILLFIEIFKYKKLYGYLLSIYPIWISIATTLNVALWILN